MPRDRSTGLVARVTVLLPAAGLDRTGELPGARGQTANLPPAKRRAHLALLVAPLWTAALPAPHLQTQIAEPEDHFPASAPNPPRHLCRRCQRLEEAPAG
jgi:hypothetical protein